MPVVSIELAEPISTCWASGDHRASPPVSPQGAVVFDISDDQSAYKNTPRTIF